MPVKSCGPPQAWGRILLVAAHPDDEVLALGGHFGLVHPRVFHLTNGADPHCVRSEKLAERRAKELRRALALGRVPSHRCFSGGAADQSAVDCIPALVHRLSAVVRRTRPDCLLTHPYEGGHPDHDVASWLSAHVARLHHHLPVLEFTSYHNGTPFNSEASWKTGAFLDNAGAVTSIALTAVQQHRKVLLLRSFRSQAEVLRRFEKTHELFRAAPQYRFDYPPHTGTLLYESFGWNIGFTSWQSRLAEGVRALGRPAEVGGCK